MTDDVRGGGPYGQANQPWPPSRPVASPPASGGGKPGEHAAPWAVRLPAPPPRPAAPPPVLPSPRSPEPPSAAGRYPPDGYQGYVFPAPPMAPAPTGPKRGGGRPGLLIAAVVVCLLAGGGGVTWYLLKGPGADKTGSSSAAYGAPLSTSASAQSGASSTDTAASSASDSGTPSTSSSAPTSAPAAPTAVTEQEAVVQLETLRADSLPRLVLDGRWVAQVASKSVGITDPLQTAANGTHTFYAVDILAESRSAVSSVSPTSVLVLRSTDFGKRSHARDGQAYWITLVDVGFTGSDQVTAWCASTYPTLTPQQLANACAPRTLVPPHD